MKLTRLILILTMTLTPIATQAQTTAELLGYPADAKLLIIHGDDIGMCHSHNVAAIDALEKGIVTSGSIMVPCPWLLEIAEYAKAKPDADLGLHLTLTSEWKRYRWRPLAALPLVKGLIDAEGYIHHDVESTVRNAKPEEVEAELRAQIEHALASGIKPTHMDSHMGTIYADTRFVKVALNLSEEYDIPFMFFHPTPSVMQMAEGRFDHDIYNELKKRNVPMLDGLYSIHDTPVERAEPFYKNLIRNLQPGVSELILHLAVPGDEIKAITGSHRQRAEDYRLFTSESMRQFIKEQGVNLIGWKDLKPLWDKRIRVQ